MTLGIMQKYVDILINKNNSCQQETEIKREFDENQVSTYETNNNMKNDLAYKTSKILYVLKKM